MGEIVRVRTARTESLASLVVVGCRSDVDLVSQQRRPHYGGCASAVRSLQKTPLPGFRPQIISSHDTSVSDENITCKRHRSTRTSHLRFRYVTLYYVFHRRCILSPVLRCSALFALPNTRLVHTCFTFLFILLPPIEL